MTDNTRRPRLPTTDVPLLSRRLIVTMGKGGVGKSVVSAAMALVAARRGKKTLLAQLNAKDRISEYLGWETVTHEIKRYEQNLWGINIDPGETLKEYVLLQVKLQAIYRIVFENRFVSAFLKAVPALSDLLMLGKVEYELGRSMKKTGLDAFDVVIIDGPPTGHGMFFLSVPTTMAQAARSGPIREASLSMAGMLSDAEHTAVALVTLPEEMPISETIDAYIDMQRNISVTPQLLVVNRLDASQADPELSNNIDALLKLSSNDAVVEELAHLAKDEMAATNLRKAHTQRLLKEVEINTLVLPDLDSQRFGRKDVEALATILEQVL